MTSFTELGLNDDLLSALHDLGFESPTPIQSKAIPILLEGTTDFVGLAQTGTGKTAAFGLPLIQLTDENQRFPQALIICPTRELCIQINNDLSDFKKYTQHKTEAVYGGTAISTQISSLKRGVQIVAATPGRLIDLIDRKAIDLKQVKYVVLDEADEMLNMGFRDDIDHILENTPNRRSLWLFSATMPNEVRTIANNFMSSPKEITIGKKNATNTNIDHQYFVISAHHRFDALKRLIDFNSGMYGIIFTRTKAGAQDVTERLNKAGYDVEALHGDLSQQQRDRVMKRFRNKSVQMLAATDVAARGIDVDGITHVINYELPDDPEVYTHRSGRTGRAGKNGICYSLCHSREISRIHEIERLIKAPMQKMDIPEGNEVRRKIFFNFMDSLLHSTEEIQDINSLLDEAESKFQSLTKRDLLYKIAARDLKDTFEYYSNAEDLNIKKISKDKKERKEFNHRSSNGFQKLFINLGTKDGFHKANFLQFILNESDLKKSSVGRIDLREMHTWMDVENSVSTKMIKKLNGKKYKGRTLRINEANNRRSN